MIAHIEQMMGLPVGKGTEHEHASHAEHGDDDEEDPPYESAQRLIKASKLIGSSGARPRVHHQALRRAAHTLWNADPPSARMTGVIGPVGFENFFRELADLIAAGPPQFSDVLALTDQYGLQFGQPDSLPGLISRYGLTPPPGA